MNRRTEFLGKLAEAATYNELVFNRGLELIDVRDNPYYQTMDIDYLMVDKDGNKSTLEVKADKNMGDTGNLFIEMYSDRDVVRKPGWFETTQAEYLCFYDTANRKGYIISHAIIASLLDEYKIPEQEMYDYEDNKHRGYKLLPMYRVTDKNIVYK